jgi:hypothetical protein
MFKALNNEQRDIGANQTENVGGDETITVGGPTSGGNFTLNALKTITLNVGPVGSPLTQITMDETSIILNVGPGGSLAKVVVNEAGVTISATGASQLIIQPTEINTVTPMTNLTYGPVTFVSPMVTIPLVTIGAGTASGLPII